jgi:hypothetical protein
METLEIPVSYNDKELSFKARVVRFGYVNNIIVDLDGVNVTIERDEEGYFWALGDAEQIEASAVDNDLIKEVIKVLQSL